MELGFWLLLAAIVLGVGLVIWDTRRPGARRLTAADLPDLDLLASQIRDEAAETALEIANRVKAEFLAELKPETEDATPNPGGCTKESHVWRRRPHLVSGYEEVYYCAKGCMSTLRHRVK